MDMQMLAVDLCNIVHKWHLKAATMTSFTQHQRTQSEQIVHLVLKIEHPTPFITRKVFAEREAQAKR